MGIRNPRQLADIEFEDASDEGITNIQFKVLQRIGREHSALSSDGPASMDRPTRRLRCPRQRHQRDCRGLNAPPSTGDVEMQEMALPLAPPLPPINEQLLGGEAAEALPVADGALTKSGEGQSAQL